MTSKRRFGYVVARPSEFAIHRRRGRTRKMGLGISFVCLPLIDRYYLIPSSAQSLKRRIRSPQKTKAWKLLGSRCGR